MGKEKLEKKIAEQIVCPDCGTAMEYKDIDKYRRGLPAELMGMDLIDFFKNKTGIFKEETGNRRVTNILYNLYGGRMFKQYVELPNNRYTMKWYGKKVSKVKDLYALTKREIGGVMNAGRKTWEGINEALQENNLPPLVLPYEYIVNYPLKKNKKR